MFTKKKEQATYDKFRQKMIESCGVEFLRLASKEVEINLEEAVKRITKVVSVREKQIYYYLQWIPAEKLKTGDPILYECNRKLAVIDEIKESLVL